MAVREVRLMLGGQERVLRSELGAWAAIEDQGFDFTELIRRTADPGATKMRAILVLLWGFLADRPRPSLEEVGGWVDTDNFGMVTAKIREAFADANPPPVSDANPPAADAGTGQSSASSAPVSA